MKKMPRILLIMITLVSVCCAALFITKAISSPGFEPEIKQTPECTNGICKIEFKTPYQTKLDTISPAPAINLIQNNPPGTQVKYLGSSDSRLITSLAKGNWLLFISGIWFFGLLLSFTPCVLPLLLLIAGFLAQSSEISYKRSISLSFTYVMSLAITFAILGTLASSFGIYLSSYFQNPWVVGTFSSILGLLALSLLGFYKIKLPSRLQHIAVRHNKLQSNYHFIEVAVMGMIATLITSPCIAAPLVGVLSYISQTGSLLLGAIGLFIFGIGMGTPLLVATIVNKEILPNIGPWQHVIKFFFGVILFGMAIWISCRIIPNPWINTKGYWEGEIWNRRKSGELFPEYLTISTLKDLYDKRCYFIGVFSDISLLKKDMYEKLRYALYDPLTELPNRSLYHDRVENALMKSQSDPALQHAIFYMDLDEFKSVNDTYGHLVGDQLLKQAGQRLSRVIRSTDTIARVGGDEFTAVLYGIHDKAYADHTAQRMVESIEQPFEIDGKKINTSISIGICLYPHDADNMNALLSRADKAMYQAKKSKSKIAFFEPLA